MSAPRNLLGGEVASWAGNALQIECAFTEADEKTIITDVSAADSVTVEIYASQTAGADLLASVTVDAADINQTLVQANFDAGTDQHLTASFTAAETALNLAGATSLTCWLVISMLPTGPGATPVTVYAGAIKFFEDVTPAAGAIYANGNKVASGTAYTGGSYTLTGLTPTRIYKWTKVGGISITVDGVTYTSSAVFEAPASGEITMTGTGTATITDTITYCTVLPSDIADARYQMTGGNQFTTFEMFDFGTNAYRTVRLNNGSIEVAP